MTFVGRERVLDRTRSGIERAATGSSRALLRVLIRAMLACAFVLAAPLIGRAQEDAFEQATWGDLVGRYLQDPVGTRRDMLALGRGDLGALPPPLLVLIADAQLRGGRYRSAARLFERAAATNLEPPWDGIASLGAGLAHLGRGDFDGAQPFLTRAMDFPGAAGDVAALAVGQLAAAEGRYDAADQAFDRVQASEEVRPEVAEAAAFAHASAAYASGDTARAAALFGAIAAADEDSPIAAEARYGAALALLEDGQRDLALAALRRLSEDCRRDGRGGRSSSSLADLEPRAVVRRWLRNYREVGFDLQPSGEDAVPLGSLGGCRLARAKLASLEREARGADAVAAPPAQASEVVATRSEAATAAATTRGTERKLPAAAKQPAGGGAAALWLLAALAAGGAAVGLVTRRLARRASPR